MRETVTVTSPHTGAGKWREIGDTYEVSSDYARILAALKKVARGKPEKTAPALGGVNPPLAVVDDVEAELSKARADYAEKFGKPPHHKMKLAGILAAIAAE